MGLRIVKRIREDYGHITEDVNPFGHDKGRMGETQEEAAGDEQTEDMAGGFLPEGFEAEDVDEEKEEPRYTSGFFPATNTDDEDDDGDDPLEVIHGDAPDEHEHSLARMVTDEPVEFNPEPKAGNKKKAPRKAAANKAKNTATASATQSGTSAPRTKGSLAGRPRARARRNAPSPLDEEEVDEIPDSDDGDEFEDDDEHDDEDDDDYKA
jgi:xeroderma pigmentosum group C-complementing protein